MQDNITPPPPPNTGAYPRKYSASKSSALDPIEYTVAAPGANPTFPSILHPEIPHVSTDFPTEESLRKHLGLPPLSSYHICSAGGCMTQLSDGSPEVCSKHQAPAFDPAKPVQTRDGRPARILCTDQKRPGPDYPIVALLTSLGGSYEYPASYSNEGKHSGGLSDVDLVNIPPPKIKISRWLNVYGPREMYLHDSRESADKSATDTRRIACVPINLEVSEGEGL